MSTQYKFINSYISKNISDIAKAKSMASLLTLKEPVNFTIKYTKEPDDFMKKYIETIIKKINERLIELKDKMHSYENNLKECKKLYDKKIMHENTFKERIQRETHDYIKASTELNELEKLSCEPKSSDDEKEMEKIFVKYFIASEMPEDQVLASYNIYKEKFNWNKNESYRQFSFLDKYCDCVKEALKKQIIADTKEKYDGRNYDGIFSNLETIDNCIDVMEFLLNPPDCLKTHLQDELVL